MDSDLPQYAVPLACELIIANVIEQGAKLEGDKYVCWIAWTSSYGDTHLMQSSRPTVSINAMSSVSQQLPSKLLLQSNLHASL